MKRQQRRWRIDMILIHCPQSDAEWEAYLFIRANPKGRHHERWRHIHGCGRFFNAVRDTVTDKFETTYKAGEPRK
jgi:sarcosine oxidase, subunit delta